MTNKNTNYNKTKVEASPDIEVQLEALKLEVETNLAEHRKKTYSRFVNSITFKESTLILIKAIQHLAKIKKDK